MTWQSAKTALDVTGTLVMIAAGIVLGWKLLADVPKPPPRSPAMRVKDVADLSIDGGKIRRSLGTGKIAIVEFSDFECPFCVRFATTVFPQLKEKFVTPGIARYVPFQFPLEEIHPRALKAAEAVECAGRQNKYWEMHLRLLARPAALEIADLHRHALAAGLNEKLFATCISTAAIDAVRADKAEGKRLGVTGTPSFFLGLVRPNGSIDLAKRIDGTLSAEEFGSEIESLRRGTGN
jgi:protein-disulfide isomerase